MLIQRVRLKTRNLDICRLTQIQQRALHCNQTMCDDAHVSTYVVIWSLQEYFIFFFSLVMFMNDHIFVHSFSWTILHLTLLF